MPRTRTDVLILFDVCLACLSTVPETQLPPLSQLLHPQQGETGNRFGRLLYLLGQSESLKRRAKYKELIMLPKEYFQQSIESHIFGAKIDPFYTFAGAIYMLASLVHSEPESNSDVVSLFPIPLDTRVIQSHSLAESHPLASLNIFFSVDYFLSRDDKLSLEATSASFVLSPGSITATYMLAGLAIGAGWLIAVTAPRALTLFRSPEAASRRLVEGLRSKAGRVCKHPLPRLDVASEASSALKMRYRNHVVIFLHGLFSTDLATFDSIITMFVERYKGKPPVLIGWPHNTLTSIDENANQLVSLICEYCSGEDISFSFICHSREGLVARSTLNRLISHSPAVYARCRQILTLGTPHEGSGLAENVGRYLGTYFLLCHTSGNAMNVVDVLSYLSMRDASGLEELAPTEATRRGRSSFISSLLERRIG